MIITRQLRWMSWAPRTWWGENYANLCTSKTHGHTFTATSINLPDPEEVPRVRDEEPFACLFWTSRRYFRSTNGFVRGDACRDENCPLVPHTHAYYIIQIRCGWIKLLIIIITIGESFGAHNRIVDDEYAWVLRSFRLINQLNQLNICDWRTSSQTSSMGCITKITHRFSST